MRALSWSFSTSTTGRTFALGHADEDQRLRRFRASFVALAQLKSGIIRIVLTHHALDKFVDRIRVEILAENIPHSLESVFSNNDAFGIVDNHWHGFALKR